MSAGRTRGRPAKGSPSLSRADVLSKALELLNADGERGLTMRALARHLAVTPMALYHHVDNRDDLIAALVDEVFGEIVATVSGDLSPFERIERLLEAYCQRASANPELVLAVFRHPGALSGPLGEFNDALRSSLQAMGVPSADVDRWLGLLVDYTHGFAVSEAAAQGKPHADALQYAYQQNIRLLTDLAQRALPELK